MKGDFRQEVEFGLENLDKVLASISAIVPQNIPANVLAPALAYECLGYYNAFEHLMVRFLKSRSMAPASGPNWHRDTLKAFESLLSETGLPLGQELSNVVTELMGFRHVATKIYGFLIDQDRLLALVNIIQSNHASLRKVVEDLLGKLASTQL
ncbi:MAG: hypothetical protein KA368_18375 [Acidobacteria bacterium]|nr:hypothetical protein [Acidobacteriota bacterium]